MEREHHLPQLASWLDTAYFASKEPRKHGSFCTSPGEAYANGLFIENNKSRIGYESSLSGYLAESLFSTVLADLSPQEYTISLSGKESDENNGCDIFVAQNGEVVGGISLKSGMSCYKRRSASRIKEFPVINVLMEHLGAKELVSLLQAGKLPNLQDLARQRLYGPEGHAMREQLRDQLLAHRSSLPEGIFKAYLGSVAENVAALHMRLRLS